jgi:hypothetical protein
MSTANSRQVAGTHYQSALQHWDIVDTWGVGYLEGCCTKYLSRFRKKNGLQDLQKADHYLQKLIEARSDHERQQLGNPVPRVEVARFLAENGITGLETAILHIVFEWTQLAQLKVARHLLAALIAEYEGSNPSPDYVNQDR